MPKSHKPVDQGQYMVSSTLALLLYSNFLIVRKGAAPKGQYPVEYRGYFVSPSVPTFVHLSICLLVYHICWLGSFGLVS